MESEILYQVSLIAAFVAGMVALFAPCCISYLLPSYFANIFKEKRRILLMTFIYSLGIFVVMLPVVLGAKVLSSFFFRMHDQLYFVGGIFLILVAFISLLGIKLPMPKVAFQRKDNQNDIFSTFTLGVFAGFTSSCCAPVLVGVITLSTLTPTLIQSLGVGVFYVLGMVAPLYLASVFMERGNILEKPFMRKKLTTLALGKKQYPIFLSNVLAAVIFASTGVLTLILLSSGGLGMPTGDSPIVKAINETAFKVTSLTKSLYGLDLVFAAIIIYLVYKLVKRAYSEI